MNKTIQMAYKINEKEYIVEANVSELDIEFHLIKPEQKAILHCPHLDQIAADMGNAYLSVDHLSERGKESILAVLEEHLKSMNSETLVKNH